MTQNIFLTGDVTAARPSRVAEKQGQTSCWSKPFVWYIKQTCLLQLLWTENCQWDQWYWYFRKQWWYIQH